MDPDYPIPIIRVTLFTPETLLPVGSILATVAGVAMMLGRGSLSFLFRCFRRSRTAFHLDRRGEPSRTSASTGPWARTWRAPVGKQ